MNEVVKYDNYMNALHFGTFTKQDYNFFMALCARAREMEDTEICLEFSYIKEISGYKRKSSDDFIAELKRMNRKLTKITCELETETEVLMFVLFSTFRIDKEQETLSITVNEPFRFILNGIASNFTRFELAEFVGLESKYSKTLYRKLKQFRMTGMYTVGVNELRELLGCPTSYSNKRVMGDIIKPAVTELTTIWPDLSVETLYERRRGRPVRGYVFHFEPEKPPKKNTKPTYQKRKKTKKPNQFNQFEQNKYDFDELEAELLEESRERMEESIPGQMDITDYPEYMPDTR